jgi:hypothetical protein
LNGLTNKTKIALVLGIAFVIMLTALMYNPQGTSNDDFFDDRNPALHPTNRYDLPATVLLLNRAL